MSTSEHADAARFAELFGATYLLFHRRDGKRAQLSGASRAVLMHLAQAGPLTVSEATEHLDRAQSVVSDIVTQLAGHGLLERHQDRADRRRTLVWLTDAGHERLARESSVLDAQRLSAALGTLPTPARVALLNGLAALVAASATADPATPPDESSPSSPRQGDPR